MHTKYVSYYRPPFTVSICVWNVWKSGNERNEKSFCSVVSQSKGNAVPCCLRSAFFCLLSMEEYTAQWFVEVARLERCALMPSRVHANEGGLLKSDVFPPSGSR